MTKQKKSRRERRKFSPEFKADVVRLCQSGQESVAAVAKRLGLAQSSVRDWLRQAERKAGLSDSNALTTSEKNSLSFEEVTNISSHSRGLSVSGCYPGLVFSSRCRLGSEQIQ